MLQHATAVVLVAIAAIASCTTDGRASLRYRQPVFDDVAVDRGIAYRREPELLLDIYRPSPDDAPRRPALVWVHGGGFAAGDRTSSVLPFPTEFARSGYVVASIDYRLGASTQCILQAHLSDECRAAVDLAVEDAQAAVRWLRRNASAYGVDPERIAIAGESAGAITAAGVGIRARDAASSVRAWVSISGGIDGTMDVDAHDAPGLLFAGTADTFVPYAWSAAADAALQAAGVHVELVTLAGEGHVPSALSDRFVRESRDFLYDELDLG